MSKSIWILVIIAIFFGGIFWTLSETQINTDMPFYLKKYTKRTVVVQIGELKIDAEIAKTPEQREKGLSGRVALGENRGMLFIMDKPAIYSFVAKDMKFSFDIIWIKDNKVVDMTKNVPIPEIGEPLKTYEPLFEANYALEMTGGFCDTHDIKTGLEVIIDLTNIKEIK